MKTVPSSPQPQVGVGVIVLREGQVLLGKRLGSHGAGTWAFPGGHLEFGESIEACARREVMEETGLSLGALRQGPYSNDVMASEGKHYITCFIQGHALPGEPQILEPKKCERWAWFEWHRLPSSLFAPVASLVAIGFEPNAA